MIITIKIPGIRSLPYQIYPKPNTRKRNTSAPAWNSIEPQMQSVYEPGMPIKAPEERELPGRRAFAQDRDILPQRGSR
jgi:hypothetical protein